MDKLLVHGGSILKGAVHISGSKNASLPILAATLLTDQPCIIRRVPDVSDTNYMLQILTALGAEVERSSGTVRITAANIEPRCPLRNRQENARFHLCYGPPASQTS